MTVRPLLTIAFPLYRSEIFITNIKQQVDKLVRPGYQIIISDRHCQDNALNILERHYGHDDRFVFIRESDACNWVQHHNDLVKAAAGKYFMWVSHDDRYEADYCELLLAHLETHPGVTLAAGQMNTERHPLYFGEATNYNYEGLDFLNSTDVYKPLDLLKLLKSDLAPPFWNGIFRRDELIDSGLLVRYSANCVSYVEFYWVFGLALWKKINFIPQAVFTKYLQPTALHRQWMAPQYKLTHNKEAQKIVKSYIKDSPLSWGQKTTLLGGVYIFLKKKLYLYYLKHLLNINDGKPIIPTQ